MPPKKTRQRKNKPLLQLNDNIQHHLKNETNDIIFSEKKDDLYNINHSITKVNIIQEQDDEYELSIIMDIIKMQELEEMKKNEQDKLQNFERNNLLQEMLTKRDNNIKDVLRKLKILANKQNSFENTLINILENTMSTQDFHIKIDNIDFYHNIECYLGLKSNKGTIRLSDEVKEYISKMLILETTT